MNKPKIILLTLLFLLPFLLSAIANYQNISTPYFKIFYRPGWETEAMNLLQAMEYSRPYVEKLIGNELGQVPFVIEDMGNMVNGYTNPVGNKIAVFAYPPSGDVLSNGEDWWLMVGMHEYIHMAQITKIGGEPALIRAIFGNVFYPNLYQPNWMSEAITVYGESALSPYSGRMNGGTYPAIISALARAGKMPSLTKAGYNSGDYPMANHYVFGGSFYQYLCDTYGQDKLSILFEQTGSSLFSYLNPLYSNLSLDAAYQTAYGKPLETLWNEWQSHEYRKDLRFPIERVTKKGWEKSQLSFHDGALYYISYSRDKTGPFSGFGSHRIVRLNDPARSSSEETVVEQATEFPAGYQIKGKDIYYTRQELKKGYDNNEFDGLGVITEIWKKSLYGGQEKKLVSGPIRSFLVRENGSILIAEDDKTHQNNILFSFDPASGEKKRLAQLSCLIASMHEADGRLYLSARSFYQNNSIYELDLIELKLRPIINTGFAENILDVKGGKIYYQAVYDKHNGCYSYDLKTSELLRIGDLFEMTDLSPDGKGGFYFISINDQGQDIYHDPLKSSPYSLPQEMVAKPYPRLDAKQDTMVLDKYPVQKGNYLANIGHALWPRLYRIPYIYATEDTLRLGIQMAGSDILGDIPFWGASLIWDSEEAELGVQVELENNFFRPIKQSLSFTSFQGISLNANQYADLYTKMNYGLTNVWTGVGLATTHGLTRKIWYPYLGTAFKWRGGSFSATNQFMYENTDQWPSDRNRKGWQCHAALKQKLGAKMEFSSKAHLAWDPEANSDEVFSSLRGYKTDQPWNENKGLTLNNTIYSPIIKIRDGIWNPNLYIEDIVAGVFFDTAIPSSRDKQQTRWSAGLELIAEVYAGYSMALGLGLRVAYNKDGLILPDLILSVSY